MSLKPVRKFGVSGQQRKEESHPICPWTGVGTHEPLPTLQHSAQRRGSFYHPWTHLGLNGRTGKRKANPDLYSSAPLTAQGPVWPFEGRKQNVEGKASCLLWNREYSKLCRYTDIDS